MPCASSRSSSCGFLGALERPLTPARAASLALLLDCALRQVQRDDRVDEPLLSAVMKIANHPPALFVCASHDAGAGRGQVLSGLDVRDRRGDRAR